MLLLPLSVCITNRLMLIELLITIAIKLNSCRLIHHRIYYNQIMLLIGFGFRQIKMDSETISEDFDNIQGKTTPLFYILPSSDSELHAPGIAGLSQAG